MRVMRRPVFFLLALFSIWATFLAAGQKKASPKNTIRLIPVLTISDEALAGDKFGDILDLALDGQGALYVCDGRAGNIKKFEGTGAFVGTIGKSGTGPGEFGKPGEVEVHGDRVFVRDLGNPRISLFDLDGKFLSSVPVDDKEGEWRRFRALPDGRFIVETEFIDRANVNASPEMRLVLHAADFSRLKTIFRKPISRNEFITEPARRNDLPPLAASVEWDLTPEGIIVVGSSGNYEIEILDPDKGKVRSWMHHFSPKAINEPAFERFMVNGRGRIWAFLPPADPKAKPVFEAFDPDGTFRGRVTCEDEWPRSALVVFFVGGVWMATSGADGGMRVARYQITN
jgi:hypothetical protein